ncbi:DUF4225 domain-containing protein [Pseudomonas fakonensis]|uniref:DUF4225 domain-containing protein n=1 Tax=Pseudomonas fakonensis TaxID=2842355 RepID=A0ABX8NB28_9PSED|nr:DUF4225 domain-containing protein [Pseudomonas fakonensis]QXH53525.1 DUF4225 domain-containing protein [Pseudomonas fakonensis]
MSQRGDYGDRLDDAFWEVNAAASRFISYGCGVSARHLRDRSLRMQFNRELAYYAKRVVEDVYQRRISPEQGLEAIRAEANSLKSQVNRVFTQVGGMAGGASQLLTGIGSCVRSYGTTCAFHGLPLIAHGGNNFYENARGMYEGRTDVVGPVRKKYQDVAKRLGYGEREGNMAYYATDLVLSGRAIGRMVVKKDAWRLFRYLKTDKEIALKQMGRGALFIEGAASTLTLNQLIEEYKK